MKLILKWLLRAVGITGVLPLIILTRIEAILTDNKSELIFGSCKEIVALCPTILGYYIRSGYYLAVCSKISPDARFLFGSMVAHRETIVGAGTVIGAHTIIGKADIGENVLLGARVSVISGKYQHGKPAERRDNRESTGEFTVVKIGDNSWIGEGSLILANIGKNCTVGAGSVVFRNVPDNATVIGNPARKVSF